MDEYYYKMMIKKTDDDEYENDSGVHDSKQSKDASICFTIRTQKDHCEVIAHENDWWWIHNTVKML